MKIIVKRFTMELVFLLFLQMKNKYKKYIALVLRLSMNIRSKTPTSGNTGHCGRMTNAVLARSAMRVNAVPFIQQKFTTAVSCQYYDNNTAIILLAQLSHTSRRRSAAIFVAQFP